MIEYIEYEGKIYPTKWIVIDDWGWEVVATESLEHALMPNGEYRDDTAKGIDEAFFYYVPDDLIDSPDLAQYVMMNTQ